MRHVAVLTALFLLSSWPALGEEEKARLDASPSPVSQIALLPLPEQGHDDVIALVKDHWQPYFQTQDPQAFGRESLRIGRFDLNGDGQAELLLLLNKPGWEAQHGFPLVVATWTAKGWNPIGWSWGDEDTVFATDDIRQTWRTVDTGTQYLYWDRGLYSRADKN